MTRTKCKKCGKKNNGTKKLCSKCSEEKKMCLKYFVPRILYILVQIFLIIFIVYFGQQLLYSSYMKDLFIFFIFVMVIIINCIVMGRAIYKEKNLNVINCLVMLISLISFCFGFLYIGKSIKAFRYENSYEIYGLRDMFSVNEAKKFKRKIDKIFEYDFDNVSSRNVIIGNFYYDEDEQIYILYLDDYYDNYRLKFYLNLDNCEILDIYWQYSDEVKLYLVKDGKKSFNFEYYYAMYITSEMIGEEVGGLASLEEDIEKEVRREFKDSANAMIVYDELHYDDENDEFYWVCHVANMDFYGSITKKNFTIYFKKKEKVEKKTTWYYGDSSFDYVDWYVNI